MIVSSDNSLLLVRGYGYVRLYSLMDRYLLLHRTKTFLYVQVEAQVDSCTLGLYLIYRPDQTTRTKMQTDQTRPRAPICDYLWDDQAASHALQ